MRCLGGVKKMSGKSKLLKRNPYKTDFCYYPFFQVLLTADGKYMPCSKHEAFITHQGRVLTSDKESIEDAWNNDYITHLRDSFLNDGKDFDGCKECWREQEMGFRPRRYDSYGYNFSGDQVKSPKMRMRVEI